MKKEILPSKVGTPRWQAEQLMKGEILVLPGKKLNHIQVMIADYMIPGMFISSLCTVTRDDTGEKFKAVLIQRTK